jgi:hypothetical protein
MLTLLKINLQAVSMACSDCDGKAAKPLDEAPDDEDFITGVTEGLEDFQEGRCKHFKNAEELEAYLLSL